MDSDFRVVSGRTACACRISKKIFTSIIPEPQQSRRGRQEMAAMELLALLCSGQQATAKSGDN
jgi:hypothetical protein